MSGFKQPSPKITEPPMFRRYPWNMPGVGLGSGSSHDDEFLIDHEDNVLVDHEGNPLIYGE